jgi:hypothetical protein
MDLKDTNLAEKLANSYKGNDLIGILKELISQF